MLLCLTFLRPSPPYQAVLEVDVELEDPHGVQEHVFPMYSYFDVVEAPHSLQVALELLDVFLPALESLLVVNSFALANAT